MMYLTTINDDDDDDGTIVDHHHPYDDGQHRVTTSATSTMVPDGACSACAMPIVERYFLLVGNRCWHVECLKCCLCQMLLGASTSCFFKDDLVFCRDDYTRQFSKRCSRCHRVLSKNDVIMKARECVYHIECFNCIICSSRLQPGEMFALGDNGHYEPLLTLTTIGCCSTTAATTSTSAHSSSCMIDDETAIINSQLQSSPILLSSRRCKSSTGSIGNKSRKRSRKYHHHHHEQLDESMELMSGGSDTALGGSQDNLNQSSSSSRSKRMRTSFKHHQLRTMKSYFNLNHNPDAKDLKQLAQKTGLTKRVLQVWFQVSKVSYSFQPQCMHHRSQNARAKYRRHVHHREGASLSPSTTIKTSSTAAAVAVASVIVKSPPPSPEAKVNDIHHHQLMLTCSPNDDDSASKTLAEYFDTNGSLL